jgi:hypothetical protein
MIEQPKYKIIKQEGPFELRHYQAFSMIEATDSDIQSYHGFRLAFDFIQGENERGQKISMTAPVVNQLNENGIQTTSFVMPQKMAFEDMPLPTNQNLRRVLVPERICAVYKFSFSPKMSTVRRFETSLKTWIEQEKYSISGSLQLARYNPPFIPGFLKRNELWIEVTKD